MMKFRFVQALMLGACLSLFSSVAYAGSGEANQATGSARAEIGVAGNPGTVSRDGIMTITEAPDSSVSQTVEPAPPVSGDILKKQKEIDRYLFEQHKDEISAMGLTITHTAPFQNHVEIGIVPFNEQNAAYLYKAFGKDGIRVVEGVQAVLLNGSDAPDYASVTSGMAPNTVTGATSEASRGEGSDSAFGNAADSGIMAPVMAQAGAADADGRSTGAMPADNERDLVYTMTAGAESAGAPEMAATAISVKSADTVMIASGAIVILLLTCGAIFVRRRKAVKP